MSPKMNKRAKGLLKLALLGALALFWCYFVRKSLTGVHELRWTLGWRASLAAGGCFMAANLLFGLLWAPLCREISGVRLGRLEAWRAAMIGWIARYLPGKIWSVAGKAYLSSPDPAHLAPVTIAITVETLWMQVSGLLLAAITLPWYPGIGVLSSRMRLMSAAFIVASFVLAWPPVFCAICNRGLRLLRQPPLPRRPRYRVLLALTLGYMAFYALLAAGFIIVTNAFAPVRLSDAPLLVGAFTASWVLGVLTFLSPGGLGVREGLLAELLMHASAIPRAQIVALVLIARILTIVVDAVCALAAFALPLAGLAAGGKPRGREKQPGPAPTEKAG